VSLLTEQTSWSNRFAWSTYVDRTDKELGPHHDVGKQRCENDSHDPGPHKTFNRLLWRELDELRSAEKNAADVGKDIVGDDERGRQEEPDHALKNVVHDKVRLHDNEVQSHMCPGKIGKLELVVACLERGDEKYES
jgi:hypothetical protein